MNTIAKYPKFSKINIKLRNQVIQFTNKFEPYSDFNFTSLLSWDTDGTTKLSMLNNNLVICLPDYLTGKPIYSILGNHKIEETIDILMEKNEQLRLVPEIIVKNLQNKNYRIKQDRNNFDYIYSLRSLSRMSGKDYKKKRNKANTFFKAQTGSELVVSCSNTVDESLSNEIIKLDKKWSKINQQPPKEAAYERKAMKTILDSFTKLNCSITTITSSGELVAFSINEIINEIYAICHFEKALTIKHQHIYTFLAREVAKDLAKHGCQLVNWEQDLGIPGLRRSKMSYKPVKMLKKYTISKVS